ncbi:MAG: hypothetical protein ACLFR7_06605 [Opitutales bacterium]
MLFLWAGLILGVTLAGASWAGIVWRREGGANLRSLQCAGLTVMFILGIFAHNLFWEATRADPLTQGWALAMTWPVFAVCLAFTVGLTGLFAYTVRFQLAHRLRAWP